MDRSAPWARSVVLGCFGSSAGRGAADDPVRSVRNFIGVAPMPSACPVAPIPSQFSALPATVKNPLFSAATTSFVLERQSLLAGRGRSSNRKRQLRLRRIALEATVRHLETMTGSSLFKLWPQRHTSSLLVLS